MVSTTTDRPVILPTGHKDDERTTAAAAGASGVLVLPELDIKGNSASLPTTPPRPKTANTTTLFEKPIPLYKLGNSLGFQDCWVSTNDPYLQNNPNIWRDDDIVEEFQKNTTEDYCGVPKRPLDPAFVTLWNSYNLQNPWNILRFWESNHGEEDSVIWLDGTGSPERTISCTELRRKAVKLAIYLKKQVNVEQGDRLILCYPPGIDFIVAFLACLFGGYIAVPVYPPTPANQTRDGDRFLDIRKNAGVKIILTNRLYSRVARLMFRLWRGGDTSDPEVRKLGPAQWVSVEDSYTVSNTAADDYAPAKVYPWTCAFLQFTSGSTSQPKGVVVTHGSLLHNVHLCGKAFGMPTYLDDSTRVGEPSFDVIPYKEFLPFMIHRHRVSKAINGHNARVFSWLPVYHDMGLIGGLMTPLFGGCQLYQMSPIDFIKKPDLWMQSISDYRCSCCAAPNFAFELAVKRTSESQVRNMSLRHLAGIICGAEPIRPSTMNKFFTKFSKAGLRDDCIIPAFGLAENTLIVSSRHVATERPKVLAIDADEFRRNNKVVPVPYGARQGESRPRTPGNSNASIYTGLIDLDMENAEWLTNHADPNDDSVLTLVGCGRAAHEVDIRIVDHKSMKEVADGEVGEVWFRSASTARGYYHMPEKTEEDFYASCVYSDGITKSEGSYMRSGDTGFIFDKELFICGRLKDMLVVRGKNYYPQDIEGVLDTVPELRAGCSIAISTEDPSNEELCIAAELRDNCFARTWTGQQLLSTIFPALSPNRAISAELSSGYNTDEEFYDTLAKRMASLVQSQVGIAVSRVFLLKGRSMAKTTSGKVRRHAARMSLLNENKRQEGLLYTCAISNDSDRNLVKVPLESIVYRDDWSDLDENVMFEELLDELLYILIDVVPSTALPKLETSKRTSIINKNREIVSGFLDKAVFDLGMDSPAMVEFGERIRRRIHDDFDIFNPEMVLHVSTIAHLIFYIGRKVRNEEIDDDLSSSRHNPSIRAKMVDWAVRTLSSKREEIDAQEYQVDPIDDTKILCDRIQISPASCQPVKHPSEWRKVLLTGCTGFLGQWQLRYILELFPRVDIAIIIRAESKPEAWDRILKLQDGYFKAYRHRLELLCGDITNHNFGLEERAYDNLCRKVDVVLHTAANINLFSSYNRLRKTNVLATIRLIDFCSTHSLKPLNFASTLGIFPAYFALWKDGFEDYVLEEGLKPNVKDMKDMFPPTAMGYPWTKYACEKILDRAHSEGLPVTVFRFPLTCMSYSSGYTQTDNVMVPLMLSAVQEGIIPRNFIMNANTPCDVAAQHTVVVALTGATISKTREPWMHHTMNRILHAVGASKGEEIERPHTDTNALDSMPVLHMCDPTKVTGSKISVWLSELGVPIDLVDDPMTLLDAASERGKTSALRDVIHLTRSPVSKYWFGNAQSMVGVKDLPINTSYSRNKINWAWQVYDQGACPKPEEIWPNPRELFKRAFLYMIKNNILTEISAGVVGQMFESGEEILQLNYSLRSQGTMSPVTSSERDHHQHHHHHQFSASIGGPYSVRSEAFAQAQSMMASVCQRAARGYYDPVDNSSAMTCTPPHHPLSTSGQLILSMWAKYSGALAHDLMATPVCDSEEKPPTLPAYDQPAVLLIQSADRLAAAALQTLLVEGTLMGAFAAPSLKECMPRSVRPDLAVELLEVHEALGILGMGYTSGASLMKSIKGVLNTEDLEQLASAPADDTLLLEMIPDSTPVPSFECLLGLDDINFHEKWTMRYAYHKQFLSRRDLYREGQVLVLSSPLHSMHIEELQQCYPNLYVVSIDSDARDRWETEARQLSEVVEGSDTNRETYVTNWLKLYDSIVSSMSDLKANPKSLKGRHINITSQQLTDSPLNCLNRVLGLLKPDLNPGSSQQLSMMPMINMILKYQSWKKIHDFLRSTVLTKKAVIDGLDYLFIGLDRSGELYYRGNRFFRICIDTYQKCGNLLKRLSNK